MPVITGKKKVILSPYSTYREQVFRENEIVFTTFQLIEVKL